MRWSLPSSSSREYFEISQNLSLTAVMAPPRVGGGDDRRLIERELHVAELLQESLPALPVLLPVGDVQAGEDHAGHHAVGQAERRRVPGHQALAARPADHGALEVARLLVAGHGPLEERSHARPDRSRHERVEPARTEDVGLVPAEQLAARPVDVRDPPAVAQGQQHRLRHVEVVVELDGHEDRRHASSDVTHGATIPAEQAWKRIDIDVGLMLGVCAAERNGVRRGRNWIGSCIGDRRRTSPAERGNRPGLE